MAHRQAVIHITAITDRVEGECPTCGFDALIRVRGYHLTSNSVGLLADVTLCGRCANEGERRDHDGHDLG